jgi:hypothetical protein
MNWNGELQNITIGTLFKFFGKALVASTLWVVIWYAIIMIPIFIIMFLVMPEFP